MQLCDDVLMSIFLHLPPESVPIAGSVCRAWRTAAADPAIWKILAQEAFGAAVTNGLLNCKHLFESKAWTRANWRSSRPATTSGAFIVASVPPSWFVTAVTGSLSGIAVAGGLDGTVYVWNQTSHSLLGTFRGHGLAVSALAIDEEARHIYSGSWDRTVRIWSMASGACIRMWQAHSRAVTDLQPLRYSLSNLTMLITGGRDGKVCFWDVGAVETVSGVPRDTPKLLSCTGSEDWPVLALRPLPVASCRGNAKPGVFVDVAYADGSVFRWECTSQQCGSSNDVLTRFNPQPVLEQLAPPLWCPGKTQRLPRLAVAMVRDLVIEATRRSVCARSEHTEVKFGPRTGPSFSLERLQMSGPSLWEWESADQMSCITCLVADERRVVVTGETIRRSESDPVYGKVAVLDTQTGALLHTVHVASPVMTVSLAENHLLVGCKDGALRYIDYTATKPPKVHATTLWQKCSHAISGLFEQLVV